MTTKPPLFHDEAKAKRGPDGRFLPGHTPPRSPGRPPGPNGLKARAAELAREHLEEMLGCAFENIMCELEQGNLPLSMWVMEQVRTTQRDDARDRCGSILKPKELEELRAQLEELKVSVRRRSVP